MKPIPFTKNLPVPCWSWIRCLVPFLFTANYFTAFLSMFPVSLCMPFGSFLDTPQSVQRKQTSVAKGCSSEWPTAVQKIIPFSSWTGCRLATALHLKNTEQAVKVDRKTCELELSSFLCQAFIVTLLKSQNWKLTAPLLRTDLLFSFFWFTNPSPVMHIVVVCASVCVCVCVWVCACVWVIKWAYPYIFVSTPGFYKVGHHI